MKKQINTSTKAHLLRSVAYAILLATVSVIPFALGQRSANNGSAPIHPVQISNVHGTTPTVFRRSPIAPFALIGPLGVVCPATITESTSQAIVDGNSVACNAGGPTTENHYWRAFDMSTFTGGQEYDVNSVSFGIELAQSGKGTGQPLTINLYANHGSAFPAGDWQSNLIATSGSLNIPDQTDSIFQVSLTATVDTGTLELVMEVTTPDGTAVGNQFYVGSNMDPETGPSYLSAADCGVNDPTPTGDLGFPGMHIVMNVNGSCPNGSPTPTPSASVTPTATTTPSVTPSTTPSVTPSVSPSPSVTPSVSPSPSASPSVSPTPSVSPSVSPSVTPTPTTTPSVTPTATPAGGCVRGQGYWKNHPEAWPVTELQLGNTTYTQDQLLAILHEPVRGNGLLILTHQEIAAKLDIANGADGSCIQQTLADADALIGDLVVPPIGDGYLRPRDASPLAGILGDFAGGGMCAPACDGNGSPPPSPTPRQRPIPHSRPAPRR